MRKKNWPALLLWLSCLLPLAGSAAALDNITADAASITIPVPAEWQDRELKLVAAPLCDSFRQGQSYPLPALFEGRPGKAIRIDRFQSGTDLLYDNFTLTGNDVALADGACVAAVEPAAARYRGPLLRPAEIKGISCVVDIDDAVKLGARYVHENIPLNRLLALDAGPEERIIEFEYNGEKIPFRASLVEYFDARFRQFYENGIAVFVVFFNEYSDSPANLPLRHPKTTAEPPMMLAAFNTATPEGIKYFTAATAFLAERYTRPDAEYGQICALIVGNEVQQHAVWYNMGKTPYQEVARDYAHAVRLAYLASRAYNPDLRIYISLEHHWSLGLKSSLQAVPGRALLEAFNQIVRTEGDFLWNLAFHPYPENLFNPRFWLDRSARNTADTPRITFRNLGQLVEIMSREPFLYRGQCRDIALTEQGFNLEAETPEAEQLQAAAYAYAYRKVKALSPRISAFILHRHADHPDEGGLKLGVWNSDLSKKRLMYDVFAAAGTPREEAAFAFALPVIGIASFEETPEAAERCQSIFDVPAEDLCFDFLAHLPEAEEENNLALEERDIVRAAGWLTRVLFQHPPADGWGRVGFAVTLPEAAGRNLQLGFETMLGHADSDGVRFRIAVDGEVIFDAVQQPGPPTSHLLDMTAYAGKKVKIDFLVEKYGNNSADWAYWVQPSLLRSDAAAD